MAVNHSLWSLVNRLRLVKVASQRLKDSQGLNVDVNVNVDEKQLRCNDDVNKNENYRPDGTVPSSRGTSEAEGVSLHTTH